MAQSGVRRLQNTLRSAAVGGAMGGKPVGTAARFIADKAKSLKIPKVAPKMADAVKGAMIGGALGKAMRGIPAKSVIGGTIRKKRAYKVNY